MQQELAGAGHRRIQAGSAEQVPGRHGAEIVIAGDAVRRIGEQCLRGAQHGGGFPRLADQRVDPRRMQIRFVVRVVAILVVVTVGTDYPFLARRIRAVGDQCIVSEEGIEPFAGLFRAAHCRGHAADVLLHQPLVLPGRAFVKTVVRTRAVMAVALDIKLAITGAWTREAGERQLRVARVLVPDVLPVAAALFQDRRVGRFAQRLGHQRQ